MNRIFPGLLLALYFLCGCRHEVFVQQEPIPSEEECPYGSDAPGPFAVHFRFTNTADLPVYLRRECALDYTVTSCGGPSLDLSSGCTAECGSGVTSCPTCNPCPQGVVEVPVHQ